MHLSSEFSTMHDIGIDNCNNNTRDNFYGAVVMTQVIARVYPVHLMNVGQLQAAADPQSKLTDLGCKFTSMLLSSTPTIAI